MSTAHSSTHAELSPQLNEDGIDLRQVAASLGRHKILIGGITIATACLVASMHSLESRSGKAAFKLSLRTKVAALHA